MMTVFGRDDLRRLLAPHEPPCLSLFLPTHRHPPLSHQDTVRLRNLVKEVARQLSDAGLEETEGLLEPIGELADSQGWGPPRDGLAVFRSPEILAHYSLPASLPERVVVADTFHLRPLLRFLQTNQRYFLLALSQKQVRLYEGTPFSLSRVDVPGLPSSLHDALGSEHDPAFLNVRTAGRSREARIYHGHGDAEDTREEDLRRYFRTIDAAIWKVLRNEQVPLVLAGVVRYLPLFRQLSRYGLLAEQSIEGNVDDIGADELLGRARPVVDEVFRTSREQALEELEHARGRGLAELNLRAIGRHAVEGRVRRLLLGEGRSTSGLFDFETGRIRPGAADGSVPDDALDDLAQAVLVRDGEVLTLPAEQMPKGAAAAALLRW